MAFVWLIESELILQKSYIVFKKLLSEAINN